MNIQELAKKSPRQHGESEDAWRSRLTSEIIGGKHDDLFSSGEPKPELVAGKLEREIQGYLNRLVVALVNKDPLPWDPRLGCYVLVGGKALAERELSESDLERLQALPKVVELRSSGAATMHLTFPVPVVAGNMPGPVDLEEAIEGTIIPLDLSKILPKLPSYNRIKG